MDIYALGRGLVKRQRRRGIFRYVENLVNGLTERKDVDLTFCSSESWHFVYQCQNYLSAQLARGECSFAQPHSPFMGKVSSTFARLDEEAKFESTGLSSVRRKAAREVCRTIFKVHTGRKGEVFDLRWMPRADIFHVPDFVFLTDAARQLDVRTNFVTDRVADGDIYISMVALRQRAPDSLVKSISL